MRKDPWQKEGALWGRLSAFPEKGRWEWVGVRLGPDLPICRLTSRLAGVSLRTRIKAA